ncbi:MULTISPECIES: hypothetical protein [Thiorhodovibrio]|uniref:hypothetical protein n=1 Tax=Thiorhodovibrio TaxID=61593 RepID=UPI00191390FC|nr:MULTISPECIES: hypothetical protein [Thiorhodovibrio]WPL11364.1 hypothetical protein Thiosp_01097 [Thiorhodovibrio litoralis]WPL14033.1 hypothetical protein Thiosp_03864 [Thiorhodovibrio litoralis]
MSNIRALNSDNDVMREAERHGVADALRKARARADGHVSAITTTSALFIVCATPPDDGYIAFVGDGPGDLPEILARLNGARISGLDGR